MTPSRTIIALGTLWLESGGSPRILVARRRDDARVLPGFWEVPGGKLEPGESPLDAARRELAEELGVHAPASGAWEALGQFGAPEGSPAPRLTFHAFLAQAAPDCDPRPLASAEVRWVGADELLTLRWPPANAAVTAALHHWLLNRASPLAQRGGAGGG